MFCRNCGTDVTDMKYCPKCGTPTDNGNKSKAVEKMNKKLGLAIIGFVTAVLVCVLVFVSLLKRDSESIIRNINDDITPQREYITEKPVQSDVTDEKLDLKHEWWKDKAFQSADSGLYFWIEKDGTGLWFMVGTEYQNNENCAVVGCVSPSEVQVGVDEAEGYIQYKFSDTVLQSVTSVCYFYNEDKVLLLSKSDLNGKWLNESDTYFLVNAESITPSDNLSDTIGESVDNIGNYLYEGQRFECFETESGEDVVLTIRLFYDSDENGNLVSDIPSMYKGIMSDGLEFWFEPCESTSDSITYKVTCDDGSFAYLRYVIDLQ